nr:hypothetical protein BaRGS_014089 [Batillaria attramentaria]
MQQKIQTFLNTCLRRIFNIRWPEKIRNEELWERAGQEPVAKQILRRNPLEQLLHTTLADVVHKALVLQFLPQRCKFDSLTAMLQAIYHRY